MVFHHVHCREWYCKFMGKKWFYNGHNDYAGILSNCSNWHWTGFIILLHLKHNLIVPERYLNCALNITALCPRYIQNVTIMYVKCNYNVSKV